MGHVDGNSTIVSFHGTDWLEDGETTWLLSDEVERRRMAGRRWHHASGSDVHNGFSAASIGVLDIYHV